MDKKPIPIFRLEYDSKFRKEFYRKCERIFDEGFLTNHSYVNEFERAFAEILGLPYAIMTTSGTTALEAALRAIPVRGKKVILPTNAFIACADAIQSAGAEPLLVDIEPNRLGPDLQQVAKLLDQSVAAVMTIHIGGLISAEIVKLKALTANAGVALIEDCAHAHGSSRGGMVAGGFGDLAAFSFHMTKSITTGEGGAVVTNSPEWHSKLLSVRQFGKDLSEPLLHVREGSNFKVSEFVALVGVMELARAQSRIKRRQEIASLYRTRLSKTPNIMVFGADRDSRCGHYKQIITSSTGRGPFVGAFDEAKIAMTGGVYYYPLHKQPIMQNRVGNCSFPNSDWFADHHFCPPCYPELSDEEVHRICDVIDAVAQRKTPIS